MGRHAIIRTPEEQRERERKRKEYQEKYQKDYYAKHGERMRAAMKKWRAQHNGTEKPKLDRQAVKLAYTASDLMHLDSTYKLDKIINKIIRGEKVLSV